jgi:adenine-specific DNA-methyltransferase
VARAERKEGKANALVVSQATQQLLLPVGNYVLVKRFSSKEERRRIVAAVLEADDLGTDRVGVENHLNVLHHRNAGLPADLAWGLATYLNSTIVDVFFRQFNGHTQVNATDLRSLKYPSVDQLQTLGIAGRSVDHEQAAIDALVERIVPELAPV